MGARAPMTTDDLDDILELLKDRYRQLVTELEAIKDDATLNQPEVKAQDGGTTILKYAKIKQLEDSIAAVVKQIKAHMELQDVLDGDGEFIFTIESQLGL